jgi:splicing suppressor protein 51
MGQSGKPGAVPVCPPCASSNRQRFVSCHKATFHDHKASAAVYVKPTIAIACNSGVHCVEYTASWQESVKVMVQHNIPMVFTSYDAEEAAGEANVAC